VYSYFDCILYTIVILNKLLIYIFILEMYILTNIFEKSDIHIFFTVNRLNELVNTADQRIENANKSGEGKVDR
jgi:hypothetical protein